MTQKLKICKSTSRSKNVNGKKNKKDWQLISDEATVYGSAEISTKLSYSSKVEEMGV